MKEARLDKHLHRLLQKVDLIEQGKMSAEDRVFHKSVQNIMQLVETGRDNVYTLSWVLTERYYTMA